MSYNKLKEQEYIKALWAIFNDATKHFDLDDWRTVRNPYYWLSDSMPEGERLVHKIKCIEHYNNKGFPLTELTGEL
jgi:hypothetical protein